MNFYNDNDKKACAWLRELIAQGHLPPGTVDERSILEIKADELKEYAQCHFFAGVGFWSLALQWAGLGSTPGIWTGSCPCQPFSCAGAGKGTADERHLWPVFRDLIRECRPRVVFGEQVASAAVVGKVGRRIAGSSLSVWIDGVRADLEAEGYTCGHTVLGAHSVGAPHRRQRVYWVADANDGRCAARSRSQSEAAEPEGGDCKPEQRGESCRVAESSGLLGAQHGREPGREMGREAGPQNRAERGSDLLGPHTCRPSDAELPDWRTELEQGEPERRRGGLGGSGESGRPPSPTSGGQRADGAAPGSTRHAYELREDGGAPHAGGAGLAEQQRGRHEPEGQSEVAGAGRPWCDSIIHRYLDGKDRRIPAEPRLFPLADDRHPYHRGRVGLLRGAGNAIVPALAKEFIEAWKEVTR